MHHLHSHISSTEDIYVNKVNDPQSIDQGITTNRLIIPCPHYSIEQTLSISKFAKRKQGFLPIHNHMYIHAYLIQVFQLASLLTNHQVLP